MPRKRIALVILTLWMGSVGLLVASASAAEPRQPEAPLAALNVGSINLDWLFSFLGIGKIEATSGTDVEWFFQVDNDTDKTLKISKEGTGGTE